MVEILKYCIPALCVLLATWLVMRQFYKAEAEKRDLYICHKVIARQSEDIEWFAHLSALGKDKLR